MAELPSRLGIAGATQGVMAGVIQWSFGAEAVAGLRPRFAGRASESTPT
jgi:hypothetical protein